MQARILIVKHGALGDVVRTSYFCKSLYEKYQGDVLIDWLTAPMSADIISDNPYVNYMTTNSRNLIAFDYDIIYSLDDEKDIVRNVCKLKHKKIVGAYLVNDDVKYTEDTSAWFDMGLLSILGKEQADKLKKENTRGHAEIFSSIFSVTCVEPNLCMNYDEIFVESVLMDDSKLKIGINPYAGGRWPSKELQDKELIALIYKLLNNYSDEDISICLFGADKDRVRNERICKEICNKNVHVIETDSSIKILALSISKMDFMISSDSLAMHLAISQRVPTVAFFAPTSAAEIDDFGFVSKVVSMSDDYCSYKPNADNSSITADRISECAHPRIEKILQEKRKANLM